mgnify:CR=1 FL=1|jgi:hypothetical protein
MKKTNETEPFVNPFEEGVTYEHFLKAKGIKSIEDYCNENLTQTQIETLTNEINKLKTNK